MRHPFAQEALQGAAFVQADVRVVQGISQGQAGQGAQRVVRGHGQHQPVGAEVDDLQALGTHRAGNYAQVRRAIEDGADDVAVQPLLQVDTDAGAFGEEVRQQLGEKLGACGSVGEDADVPDLVTGLAAEVAFQVVHLAQDQPCVLQQALPGRGQLDPAVVPIQQSAVELPLQCLDPRAGGRGGKMGTARALGEAGGFGDMDEET